MPKYNQIHFISIFIVITQLLFFSAHAATSNSSTIAATIHTSAGDIFIQLYPKKAPLSVKNFMRYIHHFAFSGGEFYRVVGVDNDQGTPPISVIQGRGNLQFESFPPVPLETTAQTGLIHEDGALSMARGGPNTATHEFFICVGEQPALDFGGLRNPDGQGFAVFGKVVGGMDIVRNIQQNRQTTKVDDPYVKNQILADPITILAITLDETPAR